MAVGSAYPQSRRGRNARRSWRATPTRAAMLLAAVVVAASLSTSSLQATHTTRNDVAATGVLTARITSSTTAPPRTPTTVCAMLYVWYGYNQATQTWTGGPGSSHWNDGPADVVEDTPVAGYYASLAQIPSQLQEMWNSGINCVVVDWWGYGVTNYSSPSQINLENTAINAAAREVFADAHSISSRLKVVLLVDAFANNLTAQAYAQVYSYIYKTFYDRYSSELLAWNGRPLLLWFNPLVPPSDSRFSSRVIGNNEGLMSPGWFFWTAPASAFNSWGGTTTSPCTCYFGPPPPSPDGFISVTPRYDDYYLYLSGARTGYMRADYNYAEGLYQTEWNDVLTQSRAGARPALVFIYSWNEYHERSTIEPHLDATAPGVSPSYLLHLTATNIAALQGS